MTTEFANPWGLTDTEARSMDAMCTYYCAKRAGAAINRSENTIRDHVKSAGKKMDAERSILEKYLKWDRFRNAQTVEVTVDNN